MTAIQDLAGKTAFVTGAGSGLGMALAGALHRAGALVMLADRDPARLDAARARLGGGDRLAVVTCDVADPDAVSRAAQACLARFGKVHLLFNNAGVSLTGQPGTTPLADWRWIVDINLMGVVHGIETFVPLMRAQGEGGHIVNTASMAGHVAAPGLGPYTATKFAVLGLSETLAQDLAPDGIGVSVLCPGWVRTDIHNTARMRPSGQAADSAAAPLAAAVESGIDPDLVADWTLDCIRAGRLHIFTHPGMAGLIRRRQSAIAADYDACANDARFVR